MHQDTTASAPAAPGWPNHLAIRFTGSGSEYFRIWIVNLLLTVVTLGLYLPWAKVRKLKYFHGNTLVGDAPLGFHGNPRRMLRGYLLVGALFGLYSVAGQFSPVAGLVALAIVIAIAPALYRAALQFRLANTSWRGLRLRFTGELREAYVLTLPVVAMLLVGIGLGVLAAVQQQERGGSAMLLLVLVPIVLLQAWAAVWMLWRTKKYQHDHYALATLQTRFSARQGQFAGLLARCMGWTVGIVAVAASIGAAAVLTGSVPSRQDQLALLGIVPLLLVLVVFVLLKPYFTARLQNLVWNHTGSDALQFHSALHVPALLSLTLKNWLLIIVTLGLYWPFAAIATARLRLEAVSLSTRDDPELLADQLRTDQGDAAGDAAGDLFGLDVGL